MQHSPVPPESVEPVPIRASTVNAPTLTLPRPLTSFLGREREIDHVRDLLRRDDVRLVTLTGPGGVGKTRIAIEVAARLDSEPPDGARFVSLDEIRDAALVRPAIGRARSGLASGRIAPGPDPLQAFHDFRGPPMLDNLEHLQEIAPLVAELLTASPGLTILATSRVILNISGEHIITVSPLETAETAGVDEATRDRTRRRPGRRALAAGNPRPAAGEAADASPSAGGNQHPRQEQPAHPVCRRRREDALCDAGYDP